MWHLYNYETGITDWDVLVPDIPRRPRAPAWPVYLRLVTHTQVWMHYAEVSSQFYFCFNTVTYCFRMGLVCNFRPLNVVQAPRGCARERKAPSQHVQCAAWYGHKNALYVHERASSPDANKPLDSMFPKSRNFTKLLFTQPKPVKDPCSRSDDRLNSIYWAKMCLQTTRQSSAHTDMPASEHTHTLSHTRRNRNVGKIEFHTSFLLCERAPLTAVAMNKCVCVWLSELKSESLTNR